MTPDLDPLPRRIARFAPWTWCRHWKPWKRRTLLAVLLIATYIEAPVFMTVGLAAIDRFALRLKAQQLNRYNYFHLIAFYPLLMAAKSSPVVNRFYHVQIDFLLNVIRPRRH